MPSPKSPTSRKPEMRQLRVMQKDISQLKENDGRQSLAIESLQVGLSSLRTETTPKLDTLLQAAHDHALIAKAGRDAEERRWVWIKRLGIAFSLLIAFFTLASMVVGCGAFLYAHYKPATGAPPAIPTFAPAP